MTYFVGGQTDGLDYNDYVDVGATPGVITGTEISIVRIASLMRNAGLTVEQIREAYYPDLTDDQAEACVLAVDAGHS
jgi:predicted DNA binding protein